MFFGIVNSDENLKFLYDILDKYCEKIKDKNYSNNDNNLN